MERFVFVAAITFAVLFALVAVVGHGHMNIGHGNFNIEFDGEGGTADLVAAAPGRMEAQVFAGEELVIKHTAAHITISPEDRADFAVEIENPGRAPMPLVSVQGNEVRIDGQLRGRIEDCREGGGANLEGYGDLALTDLPQITIRAPRSLHLSVGSGSTTEIGPSEALSVSFMGCGTVNAGDVAGESEVELAGSGVVNTGASRSLSVDLAGSGDVVAGAVAESASIDMAGSGSVTIASLTGDLETDGLGSGDVIVQGGAVTNANVDLAGSGNVQIAAPVQSLKVSIVGSGDVSVAGTVGDIDADIAGSGNVSARAVTGRVTRDIRGPGEVTIGG